MLRIFQELINTWSFMLWTPLKCDVQNSKNLSLFGDSEKPVWQNIIITFYSAPSLLWKNRFCITGKLSFHSMLWRNRVATRPFAFAVSHFPLVLFLTKLNVSGCHSRKMKLQNLIGFIKYTPDSTRKYLR